MKEINNLMYTLEINYMNKMGLNTKISVQFHDNGLQIRSIAIGNICVKEETINGRVLAGRFENSDGYCGYRYDYKNGENLLNINPQIPISTAVSLINKKKMDTDYMSAELVLSSLLRNDYRVVILDKGTLKITKIVSAENERFEKCSLQEIIDLLQSDGEERFVEQNKKIIYRIDDNCVVEEMQDLVNNDMKSQLNELSYIMGKTPQNYKELLELKNQINKTTMENSLS